MVTEKQNEFYSIKKFKNVLCFGKSGSRNKNHDLSTLYIRTVQNIQMLKMNPTDNISTVKNLKFMPHFKFKLFLTNVFFRHI